MITRRNVMTGLPLTLLGTTGIASATETADAPSQSPAAVAVASALADTDLVYLTPILASGTESSCQAEIWFVVEGGDLFVVTGADAWRARAIRKGLQQTRIWVGDVGQWRSSDGAYRELPELMARGSIAADPDTHDRVLDVFGDKYRAQWLVWGPRFRNGLADGSRVMLRYRLA